MFGRKQRIIETQKALIADLKEEIEHKERIISFQHDRIMSLQEELALHKAITMTSDIEFPNTSERSKTTFGNTDINDILFN